MQKQYYPSGTGETGHFAEEEFLGECDGKWDGTYRTWQDSFEFVVANQPKKLPEPGRLLLQAVMDELAKEEQNAQTARLLTAVRSPLDEIHGVDAVVCFMGVSVTFDFTLNEQKAESAKCDLVLHPRDLADMAYTGKKLAWKLRNRLANRTACERLHRQGNNSLREGEVLVWHAEGVI